MMRSKVVICLSLIYIGSLPVTLIASEDLTSPMRIAIKAKRFEYKPNRITLPVGQAAELHIQSLDVLHGFYIPRLNIRADLVPGKTSVVLLPPLQSGEYPFVCDIFCGMKHDHMQGRLIVK
jgi:cytochrome c oxidase subunit 2